MEDERCINESAGQQLADDHELEYFEASAKNGQNVQEVFQHLAEEMYRKKINNYDRS